MDTTTILTGALPFVLIVAAALTTLFTLLLLRRYRQATLAAMARVAGVDEAAPAAAAGPAPATRLTIDVIDRPPELPPGFDGASRAAGRVYLGAGLLYALLMGVPSQVAAGGFHPLRLLFLTACYLWPVAIVHGWVRGPAAGRRGRTFGVYLLGLAVLGVVAIWRSSELTAGQLVFLWLFINGPATVLMLAFNSRRLRAVGPLVLTVTAVATSGAFALLQIATTSDRGLWLLAAAGSFVGLGARGVFVATHFVSFIVFGFLGWLLLGRLGGAYRDKRFSDKTLTIHSTILVFGVTQSIPFAFEDPLWVASGVVAFLAFYLASRLGLGAIDRPAAGPSLLLLRVFALGRRSQLLFDSLSHAWRQRGPIHLIAGPDLATSTVEAHEFLDFLGGNLARAFVSGADDLEERIENLDLATDPDGRFRVNEFFCRADTWKLTMRRLARVSDVVLMDLRSFSPSNRGCLFEIEQLVHHVELERVLLLVDGRTERGFLETELAAIWTRLPEASPNRSAIEPRIRLYHGADRSAAAGLAAALERAAS